MLQNRFAILLAILPWLCMFATAQSVASQAYTPVAARCPAGFNLVRMAGTPGNQTLSSSEASYVQNRKAEVLPQAWKTYLSNVQSTNPSLPSYVSSILSGASSEIPTLGIATSGGGYRASIFGAGVLNALDARNSSSNTAGIGGLLQAATYLSGLSGGSWFITSLTQANFPTMQELILGPTSPTVSNNSWGGWNADYDIATPSSNPVTDTEYYTDLVEELRGKYDAGYVVTFADYWARALARHFTNGTFSSNFFDESYTHGAGILWSAVANTTSFTSYSIPFPIVVADLQAPGQNSSEIIAGDYVPLTNPIFEFNVFETGSFDPQLSAFTPTKYLGTTNNSICITNYDQSAFVAGSSSELFNTANVGSVPTLSTTYGPILSLMESILPEAKVEYDVASWPNPFYGVAPDTFIDSAQTNLNMVDGGEDGEVIPLQPLLVKARGVDVIFAIDATNDINGFADGSSLIATQNRTSLYPSAYSFPPVPTALGEFTAQNLTTRPTFFGCNTTSSNASTPLLIYLANGGPPHNGQAPVTNTSTTQLSYALSEIQAMLSQTLVIATQGYPTNGVTTDPDWPSCLACAIVDRARERAGEARSGICSTCLDRYCWDSSTLTTAASVSGTRRISSAFGQLAAFGVASAVVAMMLM
ncbi:lysophospholipase catalytic domain-containing protein [Suillus paluster]|uniref:lysophospholipase catalytic domain-containing protein n=1 Tax=Suillus paluster TaxID=48578 RepID=UPI001B86A730|nr:lysophospholipase catalytic domain-containing protein [Suillus paluster]KAG1736436.1 lysophospholipase catalytic domain-containing protein [Suillus paluster]